MTGLRMGVVAKRAGVPVSTVRYYLDKGLLPDPVRKSRNMAWYSEETVDRVLLIRELQDRAFMPLKAIAEVFERTTDPAEIRRYLGRPRPTDGNGNGHVPASEFSGEDQMTQVELDRLAVIGMIEPSEIDGVVVYRRLDAQLLQVLLRMRGLGLTPDRGYTVEQLALYTAPLEQLVRAEVALAWQGLVGRVSPSDLQTVAQEIMSSATDLVAVIHEKLVEKVLAEMAERGAAQ